eukprot:TRINITY_DN8680_c0_g1_i5.p1 TRINITY_DN8680_c0_g1~~TRINITY_DN8680_c0_g1_i5.p1  ORF type:complete len:104 (+),score=1.88 TRINITY_DN8680_c0_g1_i5:103-414(+)
MAVSSESVKLDTVSTTFSYTVAISASGKWWHWQSALTRLSLMPRSKVMLDAFFLQSGHECVCVCKRGGQRHLALTLLSLMPGSKAVQDIVSDSAAISSCGKGG